jgi:outer membrane receptor for ferrienterochelin and colicins
MEDTLAMKNRNSFSGGLVYAGILILGLLVAPLRVWAQETTETAEAELDEVKVTTSTKTEHTVDEAPVRVEVITKEELEAANVKTIQEALDYVGGVHSPSSSTSLNFGAGAVQIRGMDVRHTLILLDGQHFYGGHGSVSLQSISIEMIEQIEIVKGPASSLYGSDAMGGVINIITKKSAAKNYGSFTAQGGSRNTQIYAGGAGFGNDKYSGVISYTNRQTDGVTKATDAYDEDIVSANFRYSFNPKSKLEIGSYYSLMEMDYNYADSTQKRYGLNSKWTYTVDELSNWYLRSSAFTYKHRSGSVDGTTDSYEGEAGYSRLLGSRHLVTVGYQYHLEKMGDKVIGYNADQTINGLFFQDEIDLAPFQVVFGTRVDHHQLWGTQVNPNLSIVYRLNDQAQLRGSVGKAFTGPSLLDLYADAWQAGPYLVYANPDLEPEESVGYQLGMDYQFNEKVTGQATLFRNDVKNLISWDVSYESYPYPWYWVNVDEAVLQGLELSLKARLSKTVSGSIGYTLLDTEDKATGNELTLRPRDSVNLTLDWQTAPRWQVRLSGLLKGKRYEDEANENKLGSYFLLNLGLEHKLTDNYRLFVKIDNVTGADDVADVYDIDGAEYYVGIKARI